MIYLYEDSRQLTDSEAFFLYSAFPEAIRQRIDEIKNRERKMERVICYTLLVRALCEEYGLKKEEIRIENGKYGKPFLTGMPEIFLNLSHSDSRAVCVTGRQENGIDLQKRISFQEKLKQRICCDSEKKRVDCCHSEEEKDWMITKIWTAKEAYLKKKGTGIREDLRFLETEKEKEDFWHLNGETIKFWKRGQFILAVCSEEEMKTIKTVEFDRLMRQV